MSNDVVNHPSHYAEGRKFEPIVVFDYWDPGFNIGNALKYISRVERKSIAPPIQDLEKAIFYLNHQVEMWKNHSDFNYTTKNVSYPNPVDVAADWKLDEDLKTAVVLCYVALNAVSKEAQCEYLRLAVNSIRNEIEERKQQEI